MRHTGLLGALGAFAVVMAASPAPSLGVHVTRSCSRCSAIQEDARAQSSLSDPVRRALSRALLAGQLAPGDHDRYLHIYQAAVHLRPRLPFVRERELAYVIGTLRRIAREGRLSASRMPALFLTIDRNRQWWSAKGPPNSGARVRFPGSELIFQYYPGRGLQLQPLANFGFANGLWQAHKDDRLRALIDELIALRVERGGFSAWEYYFDFGGGSPPWISGMAEGTAMQALARAGGRLGDPRLIEIARQARGAFEHRTPVGIRVPTASGAWYALYSFAPRLYVLNGMLQALIGLDTYRARTDDRTAARLFTQGDATARARISYYDTGAWSLYSRGPGRPGAEADLNYHVLNRDFARTLCRITGASPYCTAADNFSRYLKEEPDLRPFGPAPAPAVAGRGVRFHFTLSKIGRVGITVTDSEPSAAKNANESQTTARTYLSTSAPFARGKHYFRWIPPRSRRERIYSYKLLAKDLAGNARSETGTLRVRPRRR